MKSIRTSCAIVSIFYQSFHPLHSVSGTPLTYIHTCAILILAANKLKTDNNANVTNQQEAKYYYGDDSSEFSSELEEVYEQFSKWLDDPIIKENVGKLEPRDEAVLSFASSLLKRTLSESFVGVPLTDGCLTSACIPAEENSLQNYQDKQKNRQIINARSLSLEVAKHKHRLAAQLVCKMSPSDIPFLYAINLIPKSPFKLNLVDIVTEIIKKYRIATKAMNAASVKSLPYEMNSQPLLSKLCVKNNASMQWTITSIQSHQTINCEPITVKVNCLGIGPVYAFMPFVHSASTCWWLHCFSTLRFPVSFKFQHFFETFTPFFLYYFPNHLHYCCILCVFPPATD